MPFRTWGFVGGRRPRMRTCGDSVGTSTGRSQPSGGTTPGAYYQANYGTGGRCQHIADPALDAYVAGQVLEAVAPAALEVSMAAAAQAEDERAMLDKLWQQR